MTGPLDPGSPAEREWVRALQRREAWAWERLHQVALEPVFAYVTLRCGRREDAEDLTAEVFAAAVASIDRFRGDARVVTWLIAIAHRKLLDWNRRRRRRPEVLEADIPGGEGAFIRLAERLSAPESPEAAFERRATVDGIRRLVLELPETQREALWLRCVDQLSLAEIAGVLRRSENAVKGLLHRAKLSILERLRAEEDPPCCAPVPGARPQESADVGRPFSAAVPAPRD